MKTQPNQIAFFALFVVLAMCSGCSSETTPTVSNSSTEPEPTMQIPKATSPTKNKESAPRVRINKVLLTEAQLHELEGIYGISPQPGDYWYDARSGLYGVEGYAAFGFMRPGHDFGPLPRNASGRGVGVFVNGRELPQTEWLVWSQLLGYGIQQGAYWLDHQGNAGYEGSPYALVNLYVAAQQNRVGGASGGDNFWSTRFSAGNSNAGNTQGYVSVPGYGPVGYGF